MIYDSFYAHRSTPRTTYWYADQVMFLVHWFQSKIGYYSSAAAATEHQKRERVHRSAYVSGVYLCYFIHTGAYLMLMCLQQQVPLLPQCYMSDLFSFTVHNSLLFAENNWVKLQMLSTTICKVQLY